MTLRFRDLFHWSGTIDRRTYLASGSLLTLIKLGLDHSVARLVFGRDWSLFHYVIPGETFEILSLPPEDQRFYGTMALLALPFIWLGVILTINRLRDIPLPTWMALLFFAPIPVNLIFFLVIALTGRREAHSETEPPVVLEEVGFKPSRRGGVIDWLMPENDYLCALAAIFLPVPFAIGLGYLSVHSFENYGWGLFLGVPFALPAISVLLYSHRKPRTIGQCLIVGLLWVAVMYAALFVFAFEGFICLIFTVPLVVPVVMMGATVGYLLQSLPLRPRETSRLLVALAAVLPTLIGAEAIAPRPAPLFAVVSAVDVDAPPEQVWRHVIEFSQLPEPDDWVFSTGIAYPIRAEILGRGPGAVRRCVFSTGAFVEPIEVWEEPSLLRFAVTENPPPMKEWSPRAGIHPPHLDDYLVSRRGQFKLIPLSEGRTRLEGTTWYHHNMWPAAYWRFWSDRIIRRIHMQVLRHVKRLAEDETAPQKT